MKKTTLLFMAAAIVLSASCAKQDLNQTPSSTPLASLFAFDANSKTILNSDWTVDWNEGDNLTVFNAEAGSTVYSDNCRFLIDGTPSDGKFVKDPEQSSKSLVSGKSAYDWYVCYPWMEFGAKPGATKGYTVATAPQQIGYNSTSHLAGFDLMAGKAYNVAEGTTPSVALHHVCALLKFTVTNNTGEDTPITGLTLDATQGGTYITGSFTMNWGANGENPCLDPTQMGSSKAYTSSLTIKKNTGTEEEPEYVPMDENVANGASVDIYMVVAPFTVASGKTIKLTISGGLGDIVLEKKMTKDITFAAGTYSTASLSYSKPETFIFSENFGTVAVGTGKVNEYDKSGLKLGIDESDREAYAYTPYNNTSFQTADYTYTTKTTTGAYVRFPKKDASITILNINLHGYTSFEFSFTKDVASTIDVKWRYTGDKSNSWTVLASTKAEGTVKLDLTLSNPDNKKIDIQLQAKDDVVNAAYPAVDDWKLTVKE